LNETYEYVLHKEDEDRALSNADTKYDALTHAHLSPKNYTK